jgi:general secretion pathway protein D
MKNKAYIFFNMPLQIILLMGLMLGSNLLFAAPVLANKSDALSTKETERLVERLEFKKAKLTDVIRALSELSGLNIVATEAAAKKEVTVYLRNITPREAIEAVSKSSGLWYRVDGVGKSYRIMTAEEYQKDVVVFREDVTKIFTLLHPNPVVVATAVRDLYGARVQLSLGVLDTTGLGGMGGNGNSNSNSNSDSNGNSNGNSNSNSNSNPIVNMDSLKMSPEQLDRLTQALDAAGGSVSSNTINEISRSEPPILITVSREHNLIVVRTSDAFALKEIEKLIKEMDRPTQQVLLEMKILEVGSGDSFRQVFSLSDNSTTNKSNIGLGNFPSEGGTLAYSFMSKAISLRLELLEKNQKIKTLSSPILLASNNKPARVFVGEERVIVTGINTTAPTVSNGVTTPAVASAATTLKSIGNTLMILPKINADKTVTLSLQQDSSTVSVGGGSIPVLVGNTVQNFNIDTVKTASIQGTVVAKDGLTVAIGGLIRTNSSKIAQKVPFIGDLPLIGQLFQRKENIDESSELILLITPRIIANPDEGEQISREQLGSRIE